MEGILGNELLSRKGESRPRPGVEGPDDDLQEGSTRLFFGSFQP